MAKASTKNFLRVIISIIFIVLGAATAIYAIIGGIQIWPLIVGIVTLLAGVFALMKTKPLYCRIFGVVVFIVAAASFIISLIGKSPDWWSLANAVVAWLYILCIK